MFSVNRGLQKQNLPKLKDTHEYWGLNTQGRLISGFFSSLDPITPTVAELTATQSKKNAQDTQSPGLEEYKHICPHDRFLDSGNQALLYVAIPRTRSSRNPERQQEMIFRQRKYKIHGTIPTESIRAYCLERSFVSDFAGFQPFLGLAAIDFLRDLEFNRRDHMRAVGKGLFLTRNNWRNVLQDEPKALQWMENAQANETKIEILYANLFVDLRIWIMLATLLEKDYYEPNAIAMLNTLFPPVIIETPHFSFDQEILWKSRAEFYSFIVDARQKNFQNLRNTFDEYQQPNHSRSWFWLRKNVAKFLTSAESMIAEAREIQKLEDFEDNGTPALKTSKSTNFDHSEESDATKTPKKMPSLSNMYQNFRGNASSRNVSGAHLEGWYTRKLYSQSTVDVGLTKLPEFGKSTDSLRSTTGAQKSQKESSMTSMTTPEADQQNFDSMMAAPETRAFASPVPYNRQHSGSVTTRGRAPSIKPLGFNPGLEALPPIPTFVRKPTANFDDPVSPSTLAGSFSPGSRLSSDFTLDDGVEDHSRRPRNSKEGNASHLRDREQLGSPSIKTTSKARGLLSRKSGSLSKDRRSNEPLLSSPLAAQVFGMDETSEEAKDPLTTTSEEQTRARSISGKSIMPHSPRSPLRSASTPRGPTTPVFLGLPTNIGSSENPNKTPSPRLDSAGPPPQVPLPPRPDFRRGLAGPGLSPRTSYSGSSRGKTTDETEVEKSKDSWAPSGTSFAPAILRPSKGRGAALETGDFADSIASQNLPAATSSDTVLKRRALTYKEREELLYSQDPDLSNAPSPRLPFVQAHGYRYQRAELPRSQLRNDNLEFLNHDPFEQVVPPQAPMVKKKGSLSSLFTRRKASATSLGESFKQGNALGISDSGNSPADTDEIHKHQSKESSNSATSQLSGASTQSGKVPKPILKKKSSLASVADTTTFPAFPASSSPSASVATAKTPKSTKSICFNEVTQVIGPHKDSSHESNEAPVIKSRSSRAVSLESLKHAPSPSGWITNRPSQSTLRGSSQHQDQSHPRNQPHLQTQEEMECIRKLLCGSADEPESSSASSFSSANHGRHVDNFSLMTVSAGSQPFEEEPVDAAQAGTNANAAASVAGAAVAAPAPAPAPAELELEPAKPKGLRKQISKFFRR